MKVLKKSLSGALVFLLLLLALPVYASGLRAETPYLIGQVGEVVTLRLTLLDNGRPVNNAVVTWKAREAGTFLTAQLPDGTWGTPSDTVTIDSAERHVNSGEYIIQVKLAKVSNVEITVLTQGGILLYGSSATVVGHKTYDIKLVGPAPVASVPNQALRFTVTDEDGNFVDKPTELTVVGPGVSLAFTNGKVVEDEHVGKAFEFMVTPPYLGDIRVFAATDGGSKYGLTEITVEKPLIHIEPAVLTEHVITKVELSSPYLDAKGKPLPFAVRVSARDSYLTSSSGMTQLMLLPSYTKHEVPIAAWKALGAANPAVEIAVRFGDANWIPALSVPIAPLQVSLLSGQLVAGQENRVDFELLMADGSPMYMREVSLLEAWGITDANGRVSLLVRPSSVGVATLKVATDRAGVFVELPVNVLAMPVEHPQSPPAVITITLNKANPAIGLDQPPVVQGGRTLLAFRWFGEYVLGAKVDYYVEGSREVVTLVKGETRVQLVLNSRTAVVDGRQVLLDVAPFVSGGRTLVPARFLAETFGFKVEWDPKTNEVTISQ